LSASPEPSGRSCTVYQKQIRKTGEEDWTNRYIWWECMHSTQATVSLLLFADILLKGLGHEILGPPVLHRISLEIYESPGKCERYLPIIASHSKSKEE